MVNKINRKLKTLILMTMVFLMIPWSSFVCVNYHLVDANQSGTYGELLSACDASSNPISIEDNSIRFLYNGALGVMTDSNSLLYMRQRFYNTDIKRFINQDVLLGDITNSQSLNRYAYVQGNPVSYSDPFGLNPFKMIKPVLGPVLGIMHDVLGVLSIYPGFPGFLAGSINALFYFAEGNNASAINTGIKAFLTLFGPTAGKKIGKLGGKSNSGDTILSLLLIGAGVYSLPNAINNVIKDVKAIIDACKNGTDGLNMFHLICKTIEDASGVYYSTLGIVGGAKGLTSVCFTEGTVIKTEDGDKPIEEIEPGDKVWSFNPENGKKGLKEVKQTFVNEADEIEHIELQPVVETSEQSNTNDKTVTHSITIDCTPDHPFYVVDYGFKHASELKIGDRIISLDGNIYKVSSNAKESLEKPIIVYNFEVEDWHTYFVSESGIPVHNLCSEKTTIDENKESNISESSSVEVDEGGSYSPKNKTKLWGQEKYVTEKGLNTVKQHLSGEMEADYNNAMIERLENAYKNNQKISGADLDFYSHEIYESMMMKNGMSYEASHEAAKAFYNAEEFNFYHPDVIKQYNREFNPAWFRFWGIEGD